MADSAFHSGIGGAGKSANFAYVPTPTTALIASSSMRHGRSCGGAGAVYLSASGKSPRTSPVLNAKENPVSATGRRRQTVQHQPIERPTSLSMSSMSWSNAANNCKRTHGQRSPHIDGGGDVALDGISCFERSDSLARRRRTASSDAASSCSSRPASSNDATPPRASSMPQDSPNRTELSVISGQGNGRKVEKAEVQPATGGRPLVVPIVSVVDDCGNVSENLCSD